MPIRALRDQRRAALALPAPPMPPGLSVKSQGQWVEFWSSPLARVIVPALDTDAITMLFRLRDERDKVMRSGQRRRLVPGSMGQQVLNPLLPYAMKLQGEIRAIEDRLGANPKARLVLGVLLGDAARGLDDLNAEIDNESNLDDLLGDEPLDRSG